MFQIKSKKEKAKISRKILESLEKWFGLVDSREEYIKESMDEVMLAYVIDAQEVGFLCLKKTGNATVEISMIGLLEEYHHKGFGRQLITKAKDMAIKDGYSFMQVKTVKMGKCKEYDQTNLFYQSVGFKEFEVLPKLWDEWNPCQIYVMSLK